MTMLLFGPELYYLGLAFIIFLLSLRRTPKVEHDYNLTVVLAGLGFLVTIMCLGQKGDLFFKAYRVDLFSQVFKAALSLGLFLVLMISRHPALRSAAGRSFTSFSPPAPWA